MLRGWTPGLSLGLLLLMGTIVGLGQTRPAETQPPPPQQQKDPSIKIGTNLVNVPVIVTDRYGRFITGLNRGDFAIREEGLPQKIEDFSASEAPFTVALLIDTSRSTQNKLAAIRKAALSFIKQLQPNDRVMIVTFDEKVQFISDFTSNRAELEKAVKSVRSSYLTSLYDAIHLTINDKMSRIPGRKAIVILTDGVDTASKSATFESAIDLVASANIITYTIQYETRNDGGPATRPLFFPRQGGSSFAASTGVRWQDVQSKPTPPREEGKSIINIPRAPIMFPGGSSGGSVAPGTKPSSRVNSNGPQPMRDRYLIAAEFLHAVASQSGALFLRAENIENTTYAFQAIAAELRNQYTLTYISSNEQRDGSYRVIAVGMRNPELVARSRKGYRSPRDESAEPGAEKRPRP
ncbi:MAG: VWA domain-containing protein [Blastocatellia bacterium]|nr:VWA domain-containing protein [Blastocatellia bacterium]